MNQILITKKLYVTNELKRKAKFYKIEFILSLIFLIIFLSYYIYAEYDKKTSEAISREILENLSSSLYEIPNDILVVALNYDDIDFSEAVDILNSEELISETILSEDNSVVPLNTTSFQTSSGTTYTTIGIIDIPKIDLHYTIFSQASGSDLDALLKISPTKFHGSDPNSIGNFCIAGHNYRNKNFFSKVPTLEEGDIIKITDLSSKSVEYSVYKKYIVSPNDDSCLSQLTGGTREVTLVTCTNDNSQRYVIKAREIKK